MSRRREKKSNNAERRLLDGLEKLEAYESWREKILPMIEADIASGLSTDEILDKYEVYAAARLVSDLVNPRVGSESAKNILDRTKGRPTQKTETTHKFENMTDEEIASVLESELSSISYEDKH